MARKASPPQSFQKKGGFSSLWLKCAISSVFGGVAGTLFAWMIQGP